MGRAKLNMELIPKVKSRNSTFVKRKKGLKKKTFEFATLCGVDTCMIIYSPKQPGQGDRPIEPETYPNNREEVHRIIDRYRDMVRHDRGIHGKNKRDLVDFFEERKKKMDDELVKLRKKNDQLEIDMWNDWVKDFNVVELEEFMGKLESGIEKMDARIQLIKAGGGGKQSVEGMIEYNPDTGNQNLFIQSLCNLPPQPSTSTSTSTTATTFHGWRDNDIVYQPPLCYVNSSSFDHRPFQLNQYEPPHFNFDNSGPMTMMMNNGFDGLYGGGESGNYSYPIMIPTPFKYNNLPSNHDSHYPTVGMPYEDFDVENLRMPPLGGYSTAQPNTSHLQHMMPGSSSAAAQMMMHHNRNHYQPSNELSDSITNKYNKRSRFN